MISVAEADRRLLAATLACPSALVPLAAAAGRILAAPALADRPLPPGDRISMDGIALRHAAWAAGQRQFAIQGCARAGQPPPPLAAADQAVEVMTGALLPPGADTVVRVEDLEVREGVATLRPGVTLKAGQNIHPRGTDAAPGTPLLAAGQRLGAAEIAVLASVGQVPVPVAAPRIAMLATGDELVPPEATPAAWQLRGSNGPGVCAALALHGYGQATLAWVGDDEAALRRKLAELLASHDLLLLSGGVSMGRYDLVPQVLAALGVHEVFHKIAQRPGKPLWFGQQTGGPVVFGLPGNPVSSLVCLHRYVLPILARASGQPVAVPLLARLASPVKLPNELTLFLPVRLRVSDEAVLLAEPAPTQGSGDFAGLAGSEGLIELPPMGAEAPAGTLARVHRWLP